jgi:hypothetical protein
VPTPLFISACRPSPFFTRIAGVLCHTTTLSSEVSERPHARHMQREFEVLSGMDVAMLGPSGLNG